MRRLKSLRPLTAVLVLAWPVILALWDVFAYLAEGGRATITTLIRESTERYPLVGFGIGFAVGILVGHLYC